MSVSTICIFCVADYATDTAIQKALRTEFDKDNDVHHGRTSPPDDHGLRQNCMAMIK